jgi:hypothetical protein
MLTLFAWRLLVYVRSFATAVARGLPGRVYCAAKAEVGTPT